eukprot:Rmarinus@m.17298
MAFVLTPQLPGTNARPATWICSVNKNQRLNWNSSTSVRPTHDAQTTRLGVLGSVQSESAHSDMARFPVAVVSGTSLRHSDMFSDLQKTVIDTPYGSAVVHISPPDAPRQLVFVQRHHACNDGVYRAPHAINKLATFSALKQLGVRRVLMQYSVGSLRRDIPPGSILLPMDFACFWDHVTFFDMTPAGHISSVISEDLRRDALRLLKDAKVPRVLDRDFVYGQTRGPRFETRSESRMLATLGMDVVGQTGAHEVSLCGELDLECCMLCCVDNYCVGIATEANTDLDYDIFGEAVKSNQVRVEQCVRMILDDLLLANPSPAAAPVL